MIYIECEDAEEAKFAAMAMANRKIHERCKCNGNVYDPCEHCLRYYRNDELFDKFQDRFERVFYRNRVKDTDKTDILGIKKYAIYDMSQSEFLINYDGTQPHFDGIKTVRVKRLTCHYGCGCGGCLDTWEEYEIGDKFIMVEVV